MAKPKERRCESCHQMKPADKFLASSLSPTGFITKCTDCIKATAAQHRADRERKAAEHAPAKGRALVTAPPPKPIAFSDRLPERLFEVAKRFLLERQTGKPILTDQMEPELLTLLEWLAETTEQVRKSPRTLEDIGRAILDFKDASMCRGVTYGALWASLVRAESIYNQVDQLAIGVSSNPKALPVSKRKRSA